MRFTQCVGLEALVMPHVFPTVSDMGSQHLRICRKRVFTALGSSNTLGGKGAYPHGPVTTASLVDVANHCLFNPASGAEHIQGEAGRGLVGHFWSSSYKGVAE